MLELTDISKVYPPSTHALNHINLKVKKGEFCVLLGPSGAGKSTLMGLVNGLVEPTRGSINFCEERISKHNIKQLQQKVSMIHQQLNLVSRLSVLHNVLSGKLHKTPFWRVMFKLFIEKDQRRACQLLQEVDLKEEQLHRRVSTLSGGQQQRVAIARAFMSKPEIVLADEPVASLDPTVSRSVLASLKLTSRQNNTTVLCSLHQLEFALEFADRIIALRDGKIVIDCLPSEIDQAEIEMIYGNQASKNQHEKLSSVTTDSTLGEVAA